MGVARAGAVGRVWGSIVSAARAPRRVSTDGTILEHGDRWGNVSRFVVVRYVRVSSRCGNVVRYEWRQACALEVSS